MSDTTARDARLAALLRKCADELSPVVPVVKAAKKAPEAAPVVVRPTVTDSYCDPRKAPYFTGSCWDCGKDGLVANAFCGRCKKNRHAQGIAVPVVAKGKVKVAVVTAPEAPAKVRDTSNMGRRSPKAHCRSEGCGLFVKAGAKFCGKHEVAFIAPKKAKKAKRA